LCRKKLNMDQIHDIHGLRLIVENNEDCYRALRVVQRLWSEVPGKFKDYINNPKFNGYVLALACYWWLLSNVLFFSNFDFYLQLSISSYSSNG
jgi:hypothetical protein